MPIGSSSVYGHLVHILERKRPKSVLDLGIGLGANGVAVRQWLDYGVKPWRTKLVGVEGWGDYRTGIWDVYDHVEVGRIEESALLSEAWDCILMTDVIEHMAKPLGGYMLDRIGKAIAPGGVAIVSTPGHFFAQGACYGNELERHVSLWKPADFIQHGWVVLWDGTPDVHGQGMLMAGWGVDW